MSTSDEQYLRYLEAEASRLRVVEEELSKPPEPPKMQYRLKTNGAGSFVWQNGKWNRL